MAVDIGAEAIDRESFWSDNYTVIVKDKPATVRGIIDSIDIWAYEDITGLRVGTFYTTNGNTFKCRDSEAIAGTITAGSKVTKEVSITVEVGDYIGLWFDTGKIERVYAGFSGLWHINSEHIDPNDEAVYSFIDGDTISLGGYITPVKGRSYGFIIG